NRNCHGWDSTGYARTTGGYRTRTLASIHPFPAQQEGRAGVVFAHRDRDGDCWRRGGRGHSAWTRRLVFRIGRQAGCSGGAAVAGVLVLANVPGDGKRADRDDGLVGTVAVSAELSRVCSG